MDKKDLVRIIKDKLDLSEFRIIGKGAGSVILYKENDKTKEQIIISYRKYPGIFNLRSSITGWKEFKVVERILSKYFIPIDMGENTITIHHNSRKFEEIGDIDIATPEDIEKVLPQLRTMIYDDILPFFETYQTIEDVHKELTTYGNDFDKINRFLFTPQPIRRMIIKRLFSDSDWDEFAMNLTDSIVARSKQDPNSQIAVYAKFLPDLYEELKGMQPLSQS